MAQMTWQERVKGREDKLMVVNADTIKYIIAIPPGMNPMLGFSLSVVKDCVKQNFTLARIIGKL
jgi:hypothetical protein